MVSEIPHEVITSVVTSRSTHSLPFTQAHVFYWYKIGHLNSSTLGKIVGSYECIIKFGPLSSVGLNTIVNIHKFM